MQDLCKNLIPNMLAPYSDSYKEKANRNKHYRNVQK